MAFPADVLGTTSFKIWRERFNTVKNSVPERIESASSDPAATDDDYPVGSLWIRLDTDKSWILAHTTVTNDAVWNSLDNPTTIVGITGTKAEFDTACTDGDFAYSGGAFHDGFSDYVANEHIDWTNAVDNLVTASDVTANTFYVTNSVGGGLRRDVTDETLGITGSTTFSAGANIVLNGSTTAGTANDMLFRAGVATELEYDDSASTWDFAANAITTTGVITSASAVRAANASLTVENQFYMGASSATIPKLNFDTSDSLGYNRTTDEFTFYIAGLSEYFFGATEFDLTNNDLTTSGSISGVNVTSGQDPGHDHTSITSAATTTTNYYPILGSSSSAGTQTLYVDSALEFDSTLNRLKAGAFQGGYLVRDDLTGSTVIAGGNSTVSGATLNLHGPNAPFAQDIEFRGGTANLTRHLHFDFSASLWDFSDNDLITTGGLTVEWIDVAGDAGISRDTNTEYTVISGGTSGTIGANLYLYGGAHGSVPYDIYFRSDGITELQFDYSANRWDFQGNAISTTGSISGSN